MIFHPDTSFRRGKSPRGFEEIEFLRFDQKMHSNKEKPIIILLAMKQVTTFDVCVIRKVLAELVLNFLATKVAQTSFSVISL